MTTRRIEYMPVAQLTPATLNPKGHALPEIKASMDRWGFIEPMVWDERTQRLLSGHGRTETLGLAELAGMDPPEGITVDDSGHWLAPVVRGWASANDDEAKAALVAVNQLTTLGGWDDQGLAQLLGELDQAGTTLVGTGFTDDDLHALVAQLASNDPEQPFQYAGGPSLADRFIVAPMSVLNSRSGDWRDRKRAWIERGLTDTAGRAGTVTYQAGAGNSDWYEHKAAVEKQLGRVLTSTEADKYLKHMGAGELAQTGTSAFDPVLAEVLLSWYSTSASVVIDPFAGGPTRGVMSGWLGREYHGVDLSGDQVVANAAKAEVLHVEPAPTWYQGDSSQVTTWAQDGLPESCDLVLSCPPYADLEVYSDDPADLSNMDVDGWDEGQGRALALACARLVPGGFAAIVIGEARGGATNSLYGLVGRTQRHLEEAGCEMWAHYILLTPISGARLTAARAFTASRSPARIHQHVLVARKSGGPKRVADQWGELASVEDALAGVKADYDEQPAAAVADGPPAWAHGFDVEDQLRPVAQLFKQQDDQYVHGAFGHLRETGVAEALASGKLHQQGGAAVIVSTAKTRRAVSDFAGTECATIERGDVVISRVACEPGAEAALLALVRQVTAGARAYWLSGWQESPTFRALVADLGLTLAAVNVRASSEIVATYTTRQPTGRTRQADTYGLRRLALAVPRGPDLSAVASQWAQHYSTYNKRGTWSALALRGYGDAAFVEKPAEMSKAWKEQHPDRLTAVVADTALRSTALGQALDELVALVPGEHQRVRLMKLAPGGGELARHADITDPEAGTGDRQVLRIHLPLVTNPGVEFTSWRLDGTTQRVHMATREAWYLDTRKPHRAINAGASDRVHLVIDAFSSPELLALLAAGDDGATG